jgi:hypothetical protein
MELRWESGEKLESVTAPHPSPMAGLWGLVVCPFGEKDV